MLQFYYLLNFKIQSGIEVNKNIKHLTETNCLTFLKEIRQYHLIELVLFSIIRNNYKFHTQDSKYYNKYKIRIALSNA